MFVDSCRLGVRARGRRKGRRASEDDAYVRGLTKPVLPVLSSLDLKNPFLEASLKEAVAPIVAACSPA
eukprot:644737-Pyramimonas_sp.AAC.1